MKLDEQISNLGKRVGRNLAAPFIRRPVGTTLLTIGVALAGIAAYFVLPVSPLPQFDSPTISVSASLPGASPQSMSNSVATPLEQRLGAISAVTQMTSSSSVGSSNITLQFDLNRDINGAARDVQAAINAARADLPATLKSNPTYRKVNPADAPILILALTSETKTPGQIYDAVANIVEQRLLQISGVGDVELGGATLPAVRVEIEPTALARLGVSLEDVRAALSAANANRPKGAIEDAAQRYQLYVNDTGRMAADFRDLVVAWRNGAGVRLSDVGNVIDSVEDTHTLGLFNGKPAVIIVITRQPNANIIATVDEIKAALPALREDLPRDVILDVASDRTLSIRSSLTEVEITLAIAVILVVCVVGFFLSGRGATWIPAVAVIVSILGTLGVMYLCGFSLNNLSLMALTVATGFVVDDAIVVLENISRHLEAGMSRVNAALLGAREVAFTVVSISVSLVAVFIPLLFMTGIVGRMFREFAVTLSAAVIISLLISLSTTPMLCALALHSRNPATPLSRSEVWSQRLFGRLTASYARALDWALAHRRAVIASLVITVLLNIFLFSIVPKGFFPQQDSGQLQAGLRADQSISFDAMKKKLTAIVNVMHADPSVEAVVGFTGGRRAGGGFVYLTLKPYSITHERSAQIIARLRPKLARITGVSVILNPVQDIQTGGRQSNAQYQYTLKGDNREELRTWAGRLADQLKQESALTDVDTDQADHGLQTYVNVDRASAARLGVTATGIDNVLYDAFGQRPVSTIYTNLNQYRVIMEVDPKYSATPSALNDVYVPARGISATSGPLTNLVAVRNPATGSAVSRSAAEMIPLAAFAQFASSSSPTRINHQDTSLATTITFNLAPGASLSDASNAIAHAYARIGMPNAVHGSFQGTAKTFQDSLKSEPALILAALVAIYLVLGMLYESYVHPLTVLSTLPSAGVGAVLALMLLGLDFSIIALIGLILLIGIVKKNAIMMIDFALDAERSRGLSPQQAIREAALLRFRPIAMTTLAAGLGALPLAIGFGTGAALRQPLGIAIIGGLLVSQVLTLLTTPVVYLYLDRLRRPALSEQARITIGGEVHVL
jgi:multidrug efflux pump